MYIQQLHISGFRNIKSVDLAPIQGFNQFIGNNGAGKTSILEALYLLSAGHTFRTRKTKDLISRASDSYAVMARFTADNQSTKHQAGLSRSRTGDTQLKLDFEKIGSIAELSRLLPVKAISPDSHKLVQEGPDLRRQFIDWGVFHVEHEFFQLWRNYKRTLQQRNTALKMHRSHDEIGAWDQELVQHGIPLSDMREQYVATLIPEVLHFTSAFGLQRPIDIAYRQGWAAETDFLEALTREGLQKHRSPFTTVGPHRAELSLRSEGMSAREVLSRGEQKMLVYALHFAQLALMCKSVEQAPIMICDDLSAELDTGHQKLILQALSELKVQTFISGNSAVEPPSEDAQKVFHVEHGAVVKVL